jgi:hypothetical protein
MSPEEKPEQRIEQTLKEAPLAPRELVARLRGMGVSDTAASAAILDLLNRGKLILAWDRKLHDLREVLQSSQQLAKTARQLKAATASREWESVTETVRRVQELADSTSVWRDLVSNADKWHRIGEEAARLQNLLSGQRRWKAIEETAAALQKLAAAGRPSITTGASEPPSQQERKGARTASQSPREEAISGSAKRVRKVRPKQIAKARKARRVRVVS